MLPRVRLRTFVVLVAVSALDTIHTGPFAQSVDQPVAAGQVASLIDEGHYDEAEALADRLFRAAAGTPNAGSVGASLVQALIWNGRGPKPETRDLAQGLLREARASSSSADVATALRNVGQVLYEAGDYAGAVGSLKEALAIREKTQATSPQLPEDLERLAQALFEVVSTDSTAYGTGVALADRAVESRRSANDQRGLARPLRVRGLLRQRNGDYARARVDLQESLSILETSIPTHPETARALMHVGEQLAFDGALTRAIDTLTRACSMAEATLRAGHPDIADCLRRQAAAREEAGDLTTAKILRERGVEIAAVALGETHPRLAVQLNDLANNYQVQREYSTARALYERARQSYVVRLGPRSNGATVASFNLGLLDSRLGDNRQARRELQQVVSTWSQTLGPNHPNVARALTALGVVLTDQGLFAEAHELFMRALRIREQTYGGEHPFVARTLSNLADTSSRLGRPKEALELSQRALRIWERTDGPDGLAETLTTHGQLLSTTGNDTAAAGAYERALSIRTSLFGSSHPLVATSQVSLAAIEARLGQGPAAFGRAIEGQRIAREHALLALRSLPERQALEYANAPLQGLDLAASLAVTREDRNVVFNELILNRALTLDEMSARRRIASEAENSGTKSLWDALGLARQRLANLIVRGPRGNGEDYAGLLDEARARKESLERALGERSATFRASERRAAVALPQVRGALPAGAALVSFIRYDRTILRTPTRASYAAFVLRAGEEAPVLVDLGAATSIERAITSWRQELLAGATVDGAEPATAERALRVSGARLRARIWDPIVPELGGATRVFVVPDAAINRVSIAALPSKSGGYLLEGPYVVHYLSAERDLFVDESPPTPSGGLLAVGGVAFDASGARSSGQTATARSRSATIDPTDDRGLSPCLAFQTIRFPALPATRREIEEVAALWMANQPAGRESRTLLGSSASETAFKRLAPRQAILHLATHGFFLGDDCDSVAPLAGARAVGGVVASSPRRAAAPRPRSSAMLDSPLVLSGLAFAGANRRASAASDGDDGILTAEEVATLDLTGIQWAVLSACDTGLGLIRDNEGVLGLRRSFQVAGARTVIMSLWPAADDATRQWMRSLYRARLVNSRDTADSVRDAALSVLRARRSAGLSGHPFFWGGFVATGDWR